MAERLWEPTDISLSATSVPDQRKINEVIFDTGADELATLLPRPGHYVSVVSIYPIGTVPEFDDIAEAAAVGDSFAIALEWLVITGEMTSIDCEAPSSSKWSESEAEAIAAWEKQRDFLQPGEELTARPTTPEETIHELDSSIRFIEGTLAIAFMKQGGAPELPATAGEHEVLNFISE